jgi:hypothetical protein
MCFDRLVQDSKGLEPVDGGGGVRVQPASLHRLLSLFFTTHLQVLRLLLELVGLVAFVLVASALLLAVLADELAVLLLLLMALLLLLLLLLRLEQYSVVMALSLRLLLLLLLLLLAMLLLRLEQYSVVMEPWLLLLVLLLVLELELVLEPEPELAHQQVLPTVLQPLLPMQLLDLGLPLLHLELLLAAVLAHQQVLPTAPLPLQLLQQLLDLGLLPLVVLLLSALLHRCHWWWWWLLLPLLLPICAWLLGLVSFVARLQSVACAPQSLRRSSLGLQMSEALQIVVEPSIDPTALVSALPAHPCPSHLRLADTALRIDLACQLA